LWSNFPDWGYALVAILIGLVGRLMGMMHTV